MPRREDIQKQMDGCLSTDREMTLPQKIRGYFAIGFIAHILNIAERGDTEKLRAVVLEEGRAVLEWGDVDLLDPLDQAAEEIRRRGL